MAISQYYKYAAWVCCALFPLSAGADPQDCAAEAVTETVTETVIVAPTLTVATLNIAHGRRNSVNQMLLSREVIEANLGLVAEQLRETGADAVALQEADAASRWSGQFDHVQFLAGAVDMPCYFHGLHDQSRFSRYGTVIMSRYPLMASYSQTFAPSWPTKPKGFVVTRLRWKSGADDEAPQDVVMVSLHLDFSRVSVRNSQVAELITALQGITDPLIVMGDFNAEWTAKGSAVRAVAQALGLQAFDIKADNQGTYVGKNKRLDWILISSHLQFLGHRVIPSAVSDHLTVVAELAPATVLIP